MSLVRSVSVVKRDTEKNQYRFYTLMLQPDLFGQWCLIQEWGRIGRPGRVKEYAFGTEAEAMLLLEKKKREKECKGYQLPRH